MELKFDKEMDALLRKARSGTSVAAAKGGHLDADSIAAFSEGAIPDAIRRTYTAHLADCDSCREALSHVALLNEPLAMKAAAGAAPQRAAAPSPLSSVPWYRALFRTPGLAAAFGVLVLAFGGVLLYLITQRGANTSDRVAMESNKASSNLAVPYAGIEDTNSTANAASTVSNATSATASNTADRSTSNSSSNAASNTASANETVAGASGSGHAGTPSGTTTVQQPVAAAPPAGAVGGRDTGGKVAEDKPKTSTEERKDRDEDTKTTARNRALSDDGLARGEIAARKAVGGPLRSAGPVQNQVQNNAATGEMPVTRKVGGKSFHNSNGAWYDSAYKGQATTNVRRGTDEFKKLDRGLRSIANDLGGVVVVVWKDKAYRIQ